MIQITVESYIKGTIYKYMLKQVYSDILRLMIKYRKRNFSW